MKVMDENTEAEADTGNRNSDWSINRLQRNSVLILVVDDDEINQMIAGDLLEKLGCRVECADNGFTALQQTNQTQYDMILMDRIMPGVDGLETARRIRQWERLHGKRHTPIIAVTAAESDAEREACLQAGMDDFLNKPLSMNKLEQILNKYNPGQ
jgi:CheY-like chemotaxis protein